MTKRKKLNGDQAARLVPTVLEHLGRQVRQIGIIRLEDLAQDKYMHGSGIPRGHYHDVKKLCGGFLRLLSSRPDLFVLKGCTTRGCTSTCRVCSPCSPSRLHPLLLRTILLAGVHGSLRVVAAHGNVLRTIVSFV